MEIQKVDFYAQQPHYFDHLLNIWNTLPEEYKGNYYIPPYFLHNKEFDFIKYAKIRGCDVQRLYSNQKFPLLVVAGVSQRYIGNTPLILINHGAGQSYIMKNGKRHSSYAGGEDRHNVVLFIEPNDYASNLDAQRYPASRQIISGCCKLDIWHKAKLNREIKERSKIPVVAISFHWDCYVVPETRSTWSYYKSILPMLAYNNIINKWKVLGHGHPGILSTLVPEYKKHGIEIVESFDEVMERADIYICDHMSTLYEFASTDRPVVVLNAPWYRKDIEHGLRYWQYADVGINVDYPNHLEKSIDVALEDTLEQKMKRERAVAAVYKYRDGMCTERAVEGIINYLEEPKPENIINKRSNTLIEKTIRRQETWYNTS